MIPTLEMLGAAMANILFFVFCFDILLYAASQFNGRGQMWANLVCTYSFGACTHPQALAGCPNSAIYRQFSCS